MVRKPNVYALALSRVHHIQHDASVKVLLTKSFSVQSMKLIIFIDFIMLAIPMTVCDKTQTLPYEAFECFSRPTTVHFPIQPISSSP